MGIFISRCGIDEDSQVPNYPSSVNIERREDTLNNMLDLTDDLDEISLGTEVSRQMYHIPVTGIQVCVILHLVCTTLNKFEDGNVPCDNNNLYVVGIGIALTVEV